MNNKQKEAIILLSTGSPKSLGVHHVASYLSQFLNDRRIITLPKIFRYILVNFRIVPFRTLASRKRYKQIWMKDGSPLILYTESIRDKLQSKLNNTDVHIGMCFGSNTIKDLLKNIERKKYSKITLVPMFPQYASSSTGAALEIALKQISKWEAIPEIKTINSFFANPLYIDAISNKIKEYKPEEYDEVIFTYHSVPKSHLPKECQSNYNTCKHADSKFCYLADCYKTSELIANRLNLSEGKYITTFQSQLNKKWVGPFTDDVVLEKGKQNKNVLILSPSFVTDCLESTMELGMEYRDVYNKHGTNKYTLVSGLNDDDNWVNSLLEIIQD